MQKLKYQHHLQRSILCDKLFILAPDATQFRSKGGIFFFQSFSAQGQLVTFSLTQEHNKHNKRVT